MEPDPVGSESEEWRVLEKGWRVAQADDRLKLRWTPVADPSRPKPPRLDGAAGGGGAALLAMPVGH